MEQPFDYDIIPPLFVHCVNSQCLRAGECLRRKAILNARPGKYTLKIVNPADIREDGEDCRFFFADKKTTFALGITHLLDDLPYNKALAVKTNLLEHFSKGTYYRILNKERVIKPHEERYIRNLFIKLGIKEEPRFDRYVEKYNW